MKTIFLITSLLISLNLFSSIIVPGSSVSDEKAFFVVKGQYKSSVGEALSLKVKPKKGNAGERVYQLDLNATGINIVFDEILDLSNVKFKRVNNSGDLILNFNQKCQGSVCDNLKGRFAFRKRKNGNYWLHFSAKAESWNHIDSESIAFDMIMDRITFEDFRTIYKQIEGKDYLGSVINEQYVEDNYLFFGFTLFPSGFGDAFCKYSLNDIPGIKKGSIVSMDTERLSCSYDLSIFLEKKR